MKSLLELFPPNSSYNLPPNSDEIEVSVLGPGYGECVLVHFGDGRWLVVDSCVHPGSEDSAPLRYLNDLGISPDGVAVVAVSHWDDDHCKGMAQLIMACRKAQVVMSKAFVHKDFLAFVAAYSSPLTMHARSGVKQIKETVDSLSKEKRLIKTALAARRLLAAADLPMTHGLPVEVWTLSPSDEEFDNFIAWAAEQMPAIGETRRVAVKRLRNDLSIVLHIAVGKDVILLGGDLEEEGRLETGWSAILALSGRPPTKAQLFKVPHHGSKTAHHSAIPTKLLEPDPIAIVAPFKNGSSSLPSADDVSRIAAYAPNSFATTSLRGRASPRRETTVEKTIREVTKQFTTIKRDPGMIRLRKKVGGSHQWKVEQFGGAAPLAQIY